MGEPGDSTNAVRHGKEKYGTDSSTVEIKMSVALNVERKVGYYSVIKQGRNKEVTPLIPCK